MALPDNSVFLSCFAGFPQLSVLDVAVRNNIEGFLFFIFSKKKRDYILCLVFLKEQCNAMSSTFGHHFNKSEDLAGLITNEMPYFTSIRDVQVPLASEYFCKGKVALRK